MKKIKLSQGRYATVDNEDFEKVNEFKWQLWASPSGKEYAIRSAYLGRVDDVYRQKTIYMHRLIMDTPDGMDTDHRDGDGLMNTKDNLRICKHKQNMRNRKLPRNSGSGHIGVNWHRRQEKWVARIMTDGKMLQIGSFDDIEVAIRARNKKALELHGEFARRF